MTIKRWRRRLGFHAMARLAAWRAPAGLPAVQRLGERIGRLHYHLAAGQRRHLRPAIRQLFALADDDPRPAAYLKQAYPINDRAIFEILAMYSGRLTRQAVVDAVHIEALEPLDQALGEQRGVLLLGWHMGNGVALATRLAALGYPIALIHRESKKIQPGFFQRGIEGLGIVAIAAQPAAAGFRQMLKTLRAGGIVFILMDQGIKRGIEVEFLAKRVPMPAGPAELLRRTGCELVSARLTGASPHWQFKLVRETPPPAELSLEDSVQKLSRIMENHVLACPQWWTWHQRRWSRYPFAAEQADQSHGS